MKGKTVVITGGTSGIGEIAAERLAQMGARIVLIARSKSRGKVTWNLPKQYRNIALLTKWLSPAAAAWCVTHCRFDGIYPAEGIDLSRADRAPEAAT